LADYVNVTEARSMPALRLVLTAGVPGPWGEAAKGLFHVKRMPFVRVRQEGGGANPELAEWTGQTSAPVAAWNDERPRTTSTEILFLAERIAADPPLFPPRAADRALMLGMSHEIYGELGLGWCRRLMIFERVLGDASPAATATSGPGALAVKYGYSREAARAAPARVAQIVEMLATQLAREQRSGSRFLIAGQLTALDIYWATFASMLDPLPHDVCPMPAGIRALYSVDDPVVRAALDRRLLEHRDFVYREFLELPLDF